jgi:ferric-dicitrate binding protein FerR (iron transport regulator)
MERIKYLLLRFLREEATPAERAELETWAAEAPANRELMQELQDPALVAEALAKLDQLHRQEAWGKVEEHAAAVRGALAVGAEEARVRRVGGRRYFAAAAVVGGLGIGGWWFVTKHANEKPVLVQTTAPADIAAPATNRATITLASGQRVYLDSAGNGQLAKQAGINVLKLDSGTVAYQAAGKPSDLTGELIYNTLVNPRGSRVVTLALTDGTKVWLNAGSSIRYPAFFIGGSRKVQVTGEAYFEIAKNAHQPFSVEEKGMTIAVLGTSFNVNGYDDEPFSKTTLVEGKVNVNYGKVGALLEPGMQAEVYRGPNADNQVPAIKVGPANVEQALAWKNGLFAFSDADLPTVMRQLSRWYNVNVKYEGEIPKDKYQFNGKIGKTLTLDQVLKILTKTQVHYSIDGNELTIRP